MEYPLLIRIILLSTQVGNTQTQQTVTFLQQPKPTVFLHDKKHCRKPELQ